MTIHRPVKILLIALAAAALVALVVVGNITRNNSLVRGIQVTIDYGGNEPLVTADELETLLTEKMPWVLNQTVKEIDRRAIGDTLATSPYVEHVEVSVTMGCSLLINAVQRRPIVRVFRGNEEYYLDDHGKKVPLSDHGSFDVLVANGSLRSGKHVESMWHLARYLNAHPEYGCLFDQLYVDETGELQLVPKIGDHIVVVGDSVGLDDKMAHLMRFYRKAMPIVGWQSYSQVSLKYRGQVICTKRQ